MTARRISDEGLAHILAQDNAAAVAEAVSMHALRDLRDERALSAQLAEALREAEWIDGRCPICFRTPDATPNFAAGHDSDCPLGAALAAYEARNREEA